MKISKANLKDATQKDILSQSQADKLWAFLEEQRQINKTNQFANLFYYLGGFISVGAFTLFITTNFETFGNWGLVFILTLFIIGSMYLTYKFNKQGLQTPSSLTLLFIIALIPILIFSILNAFHLWSWDNTPPHYPSFINLMENQNWILESITFLVSCYLFYQFRHNLILMPILGIAWYMTIDVADFFLKSKSYLDVTSDFSILFGIIALIIALWVDLKNPLDIDYSYWFYGFGLVAFWFGLSIEYFKYEMTWMLYLFINIVLLFLGFLLNKHIFLLFGGLGTSIYLGHLAYDVFKDRLILPFILTAIGLFIMTIGMLIQKKRQHIEQFLKNQLPQPITKLMNKHR
jgi:hypothetical protein